MHASIVVGPYLAIEIVYESFGFIGTERSGGRRADTCSDTGGLPQSMHPEFLFSSIFSRLLRFTPELFPHSKGGHGLQMLLQFAETVAKALRRS